MTLPVPQIGDWIYVPSAFYLSHGVDDFCGGKALVIETGEWNANGGDHYVVINERRSTKYSWKNLAEKQEEYSQQYAGKAAHPCPDYHPSANELW